MPRRVRVRLRLLRLTTLGVAGAMALSSCGSGCTEIGYRNELRVTATGDDLTRIAEVRLCADEICAYPSTEAAPPTGRSYWVTHHSAAPDLWIYDFGDHHPDTVHLTFLDAAGSTLDQQQHTIDWTLTDEPNGPGCGWRAEPYDLTVSI